MTVVNRTPYRLARLLAVPLTLWLAWQVGIYAARQGITYIELLSGLFVIAGIVILGRGDKGLRFGYVMWIMLMALGYRTAEISRFIRIHPLTLFITALFLILLINKITHNREGIRFFIPRPLLLFCLLVLWGFFLAWSAGTSLEAALMLMINFMLLLPIFVVTRQIVRAQADWRLVISSFFGVGVLIALMGLIEIIFPDIVNVLPGFVSQAGISGLDQFGFGRAGFSFFGSPVATFICALALPFAFILHRWYTQPISHVLITGGVVLLLLGIYFGGYRSMWLTTGAVVLTMFLFSRNLARLSLVVLLTVGVYALTPEAGQERFLSLVSAAEGDFQDGSTLKRFERAEDTAAIFFQYPLGQGLFTARWTHSDILQIAADMGVMGLVIFAFWFLDTLFRLVRLYWRTKHLLDLALIGAMLVTMSVLIFQTVTVLAQLVVPFWFVWALAAVRLEQQPQPVLDPVKTAPPALLSPSRT